MTGLEPDGGHAHTGARREAVDRGDVRVCLRRGKGQRVAQPSGLLPLDLPWIFRGR